MSIKNQTLQFLPTHRQHMGTFCKGICRTSPTPLTMERNGNAVWGSATSVGPSAAGRAAPCAMERGPSVTRRMDCRPRSDSCVWVGVFLVVGKRECAQRGSIKLGGRNENPTQIAVHSDMGDVAFNFEGGNSAPVPKAYPRM